jgi:peptide/nickel transport system permease protein
VRENLSGLGLGSLAPIYPALAIASVTISASILVDATEGARSKKVIE